MIDIIAKTIEEELIDEPHKLCDLNYAYESFRKSMKGSSWKSEPQKFESRGLVNLTKLCDSLEDRTYKTAPTIEFTINERGKTRYIHGNKIQDRVVRHTLCDDVLDPILSNYIITNNAASQKGKGIKFIRETFERHLHNFYLKYRHNQGYILFVDFSKFYDNIQHNKIKDMILPLLDDKSAWLFSEIIDSFDIDISQFPKVNSQDKFDSITFHQLEPDKSLGLSQRLLGKCVDIGDQTSQTIGVVFPTRIDTYATCVRGHKWYGRYMDDIYIICENKEYLMETLEGVKKLADELGLFINGKKTRICRLSETFTFLQVKYFLTDAGKVVKRINPKSLTRERRRLKAYKRLLDKGVLNYEQIEQAYKSWVGSYCRIMSKQQIKNLQNLYLKLFGISINYKKQKGRK